MDQGFHPQNGVQGLILSDIVKEETVGFGSGLNVQSQMSDVNKPKSQKVLENVHDLAYLLESSRNIALEAGLVGKGDSEIQTTVSGATLALGG